jgi:O-antigen ligase/polysaccharide polymerase Wzy-like membrane protein
VVAAVIVAAMSSGLFQPTGYAAASIVIWAAVIAGLIARGLPTGPVGRLAAAAGLCLAGTAILGVASVGWATDQGRAFEEAVRVSFYLGLFTLAACTATRGGRVEWLAGLTVGLTAVAAVALFAYLHPGTLGSGTNDIPNAAGRLSYPVGYWNGAAAMLAATATLLAYAAFRAPWRAWRAVATAAIPVAILAIWLTQSRGGGGALVVGLAVLVAATPARDRSGQLARITIGTLGAAILIGASERFPHLTSGVVDSARHTDGDWMSAICVLVATLTGLLAWRVDGFAPRLRIPRRVAIGIGLGLIVAVALAAIALIPGNALHQFRAEPSTHAGLPTNSPELSSNGRWQFWGGAIHAFEANPIAGLGAGGFEDWWGSHASVAIFVRNPHSLPLQEAAELGTPGILLFAGFVVALMVAAWRRLRQGLGGDTGILVAVVAAGAIGALFDWSWEIPAVFAPAAICSALLLASAPARPLARDGYWLGIATVTAAWIAMVAGGLVALTELELDQSRSAASANNIGDAIDRARAAKTVQPWSAEPYIQLALLEEKQGNISGALTNLNQAEQRDSEDWRLALIKARLESQRGDQVALLRAILRAEQLSPFPLVQLSQSAG